MLKGVMMTEIKKPFGQRLASYGKWRDRTNMDRFIVITYLTAEEKMAAAEKYFGDAYVDYLDGADIDQIIIKKEI